MSEFSLSWPDSDWIFKCPYPTCPSTLVSPRWPGWLCCPVLWKPDLLIDPSGRLHLSTAVRHGSCLPLLFSSSCSQNTQVSQLKMSVVGCIDSASVIVDWQYKQ